MDQIKIGWKKCCCFFIGFLAFIWFLVRVVPRPGRAAYPCQRIAFPLATTFITYISSLLASVFAYRKARYFFSRKRYSIAFICILSAGITLIWHLNTSSVKTYAWTPSDPPNSPMGTARGIFPGRVVWVHEPDATSWDGSTGYWWEDTHVSQTVVDDMLSKSIQWLTEENTDSLAWDALFRHFNQNHGKGDVGYNYETEERIAIKINCNNSFYHDRRRKEDQIEATPHLVYALLDHLVNTMGIKDSKITVYDAARVIPDIIFDKCQPDFPNVRYMDKNGGTGSRCQVMWVDSAITYSGPVIMDSLHMLPFRVLNAAYFINMSLLKVHPHAGVTLLGKNHLGSIPTPYNLHQPPGHEFIDPNLVGMNAYSPLVDFLGHENLSGKGLLFIVDGLYGTLAQNAPPEKWDLAPFNDDWSSSLFVAQDPVALESVGLDFLLAEWPELIKDDTDNYIHEAALANDPPSGTFYDPEGDGTRLESLGVHEHWNNAADKEYTRNLGTGDGVELISNDPADSVLMTIRVFLESAFSAGEMSLYLNSAGYIPIQSPYSEDPRIISSVPNDITDWVLLELRRVQDGSALASVSVLLRKDGYLVTDDGLSTVLKIDLPPGDYYPVVRHRNHIDIIANETVALNTSTTTIYNFTTGSDKVEGAELADLGGGIYGMFAGDTNKTEVVNSADYLVVKTYSGSEGYYDEDCNLTGVVNSGDYLIIKPNSGKNSHIP